MTQNRSRVLRAVLSNAFAWGAAWGAVGGLLFTTIVLIDPTPGVETLGARIVDALSVGISWAARFGLAGLVAGAAFSGAVRLGFRGRRLKEISAVRFAVVGALVGGVSVPLYLQAMNVLFGDGPIPWRLVSSPWAAVLGAAAAAGSILVARRLASAADEPGSRPITPVTAATLPPSGAPDASASQHSRSTQL